MNFISSLKIVIFFVLTLFLAIFGQFILCTIAIPLILLNRFIYFRWCSHITGYFLLIYTCLLEDFLKIKVIITGDNLINNRKRSLIILNHRTRLDWLFIWMLHSRFEILKQLKIIMKSSLRHVPGIGWNAQHAGYLFLDRSWEKDRLKIENTIQYYKTCQYPISLLIFPEGTNLYEKSKLKSNEYASKQLTFNRSYEYCLHPRVTGFVNLIKLMRSTNIIDCVDDITIGYEGKYAVTEIDVLKGNLPTVVHFHVKRYHINDLPNDDNQLKFWLEKCWDEKEDKLKKFYEINQFDSISNRIFDHRREYKIKFQRIVLLIFGLLFTFVSFSCFLLFNQIKFYFFLLSLFQITIGIFPNGFTEFMTRF